MSDARDTILSAVRAALSNRAPDSARIQQEAAGLLDALPQSRPALNDRDRLEVFAERIASPKVEATLGYIHAISELPDAVAQYLHANALPPEIALQPAVALQAVDWRGFTLHAEMALDERVGIGIADAGIAETGSLVFHSGPETPVLASFLPLHHIVLLRASTVLLYLDDYATTLGPHGGSWRNVNIITGASGTTDIEGSLVMGAHGPCQLHIVMLLDRV